jgi:hypothetical protein
MARKKDSATRTNIVPWHRKSFSSLANGRGHFALFSCYVNGEPTAAIVAISRDIKGFVVQPMFVAVTPSMTIIDHNGTPIMPVDGP